MRRLLRRLYYRLPHGRLPWAWRRAIVAWLLGWADHNESLRDCIVGEDNDMGGKPSKGTPADRRLTQNKPLPPRPAPAPKPAKPSK